jgi:hypothetical protein
MNSSGNHHSHGAGMVKWDKPCKFDELNNDDALAALSMKRQRALQTQTK